MSPDDILELVEKLAAKGFTPAEIARLLESLAQLTKLIS